MEKHSVDPSLDHRQKEQLFSQKIVEALEKIGLPLQERLAEMLEGSAEFRCGTTTLATEEIGGYIEATRYLAQIIRHERSEHEDRDLEALFDFTRGKFPEREKELLRESPGQNRVPATQLLSSIDRNLIIETLKALPERSNQIVGGIICDLLAPVTNEELLHFEAVTDRLGIGACKQAESFFLQAIQKPIQNGCVLQDNQGTCIAWQKYNAGQPTFITFKEILLNGVRLPPGSLLCCRPTEEARGQDDEFQFKKKCISKEDIKDIRFLRLTSLAVPPSERRQAIGSLLTTHQHFHFPHAESATLEELYERVKTYVSLL